jgi:dTDP-L-rhamnose 4-epimerase
VRGSGGTLMSDRVLVTGGAGFIGSRLVRRLLDAGREVTVLDALVESVHGPDARPPAGLSRTRFIRGDVRDAAALRDALEGAGLVYHLAAETGTGESMYRARHYVDVNVGGTALLCDLIGASERPPRRVVLASSRAVYGEGPYRCPAHGIVHPEPRSRERLAKGSWDPACPMCGMTLDPHPAGPGTPSRPVSVYGMTKRDQEELLLELLPPRGVQVLALRLQNVYGPGQSLRNAYTGILSIFSVRFLGGEGVNVFEDGRESRDFVHVDDVVEAFLRAADADLAPDARVLDVGSGRPTSVLEVARMLAEACEAGQDCVTVTGDYRVGDIRHAFCDPGPLRDALGIVASITLAEGVRGLVAWVRETERGPSRLDHALDEMRAAGLLGRAKSA